MVKIQYIVYFCPRKLDSIYKLYLINRLHAKSSELVNQLRILMICGVILELFEANFSQTFKCQSNWFDPIFSMP